MLSSYEFSPLARTPRRTQEPAPLLKLRPGSVGVGCDGFVHELPGYSIVRPSWLSQVRSQAMIFFFRVENARLLLALGFRVSGPQRCRA